MFEQNGNRLLFENVYFTRRKFLPVLGLQALLEKRHSNRIDDKLLKKLIEVIRDVCGEECWALPAHVNRENQDWRLNMDLFALETGQTISELADRFREELPEDVYCLMAENVEKRVLRPLCVCKRGIWMGEIRSQLECSLRRIYWKRLPASDEGAAGLQHLYNVLPL